MIKNNIPVILKKRKMNGRQFAIALGMTPANYGHVYKHLIHKQDLSEVRVKTLVSVSGVLGCTVDDLLIVEATE